tara:strand:- start:961 stop:1194 length:234 start_codon:yes stop_codon:yes gene_type:complete
MTDWLPIEDEMLLECGRAGGEYLESLGKSDLAALSKEEWLVFLQCVVGRLQEVRPDYDRKLEAAFEAEDPFGLSPIR